MRRVVDIESRDRDLNRLKFGSGFYISPNVIATRWELIENASHVKISLPGSNASIEIEGGVFRDLKNNLALLKVKQKSMVQSLDSIADDIKSGDTLSIFNQKKSQFKDYTSSTVDSILNHQGVIRWVMDGPLAMISTGTPIFKKNKLAGIYSLRVIKGQLKIIATPVKYLLPYITNIDKIKLTELKRFCRADSSFNDLLDSTYQGVQPVHEIHMSNFEWDNLGSKKSNNTYTLQNFTVTNKMDHNISHIKLGVFIYDTNYTPIEMKQISLFEQGHLSPGRSRKVASFKLKNVKSQKSQKVLYRILDFKIGDKIVVHPSAQHSLPIQGSEEDSQGNKTEAPVPPTEKSGYLKKPEPTNIYFLSAAGVLTALFAFVIFLN